MENILLYFFSTIPQVLAAIIALIFVFVTLKLQELDKLIDIQCMNFAEILGSNVTYSINWQRLQSSGLFMSNYRAKYFIGISNIMEAICAEREKDNKHAVEQLGKIANRVKKIENERKSVIVSFKALSALGLFVIVSSISILCFVKTLSGNCKLSNTLFIVYIVLTSFSLFWVYRIMTISLK